MKSIVFATAMALMMAGCEEKKKIVVLDLGVCYTAKSSDGSYTFFKVLKKLKHGYIAQILDYEGQVVNEFYFADENQQFTLVDCPPFK